MIINLKEIVEKKQQEKLSNAQEENRVINDLAQSALSIPKIDVDEYLNKRLIERINNYYDDNENDDVIAIKITKDELIRFYKDIYTNHDNLKVLRNFEKTFTAHGYNDASNYASNVISNNLQDLFINRLHQSDNDFGITRWKNDVHEQQNKFNFDDHQMNVQLIIEFNIKNH